MSTEMIKVLVKKYLIKMSNESIKLQSIKLISKLHRNLVDTRFTGQTCLIPDFSIQRNDRWVHTKLLSESKISNISEVRFIDCLPMRFPKVCILPLNNGLHWYITTSLALKCRHHHLIDYIQIDGHIVPQEGFTRNKPPIGK